MDRHPYFDLWLHSDAELAPILPAPLTGRETLHEWPLSCVQRLTLADGSRWIYKAQTTEGVEAAFYARARSPLLPGCRDLGVYQNTRTLLFEYIDAPLLSQSSLSEQEVLAHADRLEAAIAQIAGDPPVYQNLGMFERWQAFTVRACRELDTLITDGRFVQVRKESLPPLLDWAGSDTVRAAFAVTALAHADLSAENVFLTKDGYRVIDWQYPRRIPAGFDRVALLESFGLDPLRHVTAELVGIHCFVRLAWFADCQARLFPAGETYDASCADLIERIL